MLDPEERAQIEAYLAEAQQVLADGGPGLPLDLSMWVEPGEDCPPGFVATMDHYLDPHRELLDHIEMLQREAPPGADVGLGPLQRELEAQLETYAEYDRYAICTPAEPGDAAYLDDDELLAQLRETMLEVESRGLADRFQVQPPQSVAGAVRG